MFVHEAAVIGGDGGGAYSHAAQLEAAGFCLGAGPNCMKVRVRYGLRSLAACSSAASCSCLQFLRSTEAFLMLLILT
jgi:hypothetical protein